VKSKVKGMLITFFDIDGIIHKQLDLAGQTVNSAYCCDVLQLLHENVRRHPTELRLQENWLLHHEKVPSHTSFSTTDFFLPKTT
jgi:hypothetical protein